eukprot:CAMPEP_0119334062 /NCGR_PEP_ID=MMETSP1333-20130426/86584_1 /TAXON_ID=418940 /ORGANISM="Scyphosphaera apsteinii, Strain RCC1455" /LENGTH=182 /DNA_ID=CAMNT_0007344281 /DNA_START=16 /DNA_END=561 /DNA_ORIENTATION=+
MEKEHVKRERCESEPADEMISTLTHKQARTQARLDATLAGSKFISARASSTESPSEASKMSAEEAPAPSSPAPAAAATGTVTMIEPIQDEILKAAPKLAGHIRSVAKFVKVASMASSLLEEGRVSLQNSNAFFQILEAGVAEPKRVRNSELRVAFRRLYGAAVARGGLFPPHLQPTLRLWQL